VRLKQTAARTVLAHLIKLESEGRAERDGDDWRKTDAAAS
jgi:hypothetical protein